MNRLAAAIYGVVAALGCVDLVSQLTLRPSRTDSVEADRLRAFMKELGRASRFRLQELLPAESTRALWDVVASDNLDFLTLLGRHYDENAHSDILRWLLDPRLAPSTAGAVLRGLAGMLDVSGDWRRCVERNIRLGAVSVRREVKLGRESFDPNAADRIDLLITGDDFVIGIENKVRSFEHDEQTRTYWGWISRLGFERHACFFLTPEGLPASSGDVRPISYLELAGFLLTAAAVGELQRQERIVLSAYVQTLRTSVLKRQLWGVLKERPI